MEFSYEKLDVSNLSKQIIKEVYQLTETFPKEEIYGLTSQIRRASISILLNIAEGSGKKMKKEFNRFVRIAIGSLVELDCAMKLSIELKYCKIGDYNRIEPKIKELYFKLIGLSKYLIN